MENPSSYFKLTNLKPLIDSGSVSSISPNLSGIDETILVLASRWILSHFSVKESANIECLWSMCLFSDTPPQHIRMFGIQVRSEMDSHFFDIQANSHCSVLFDVME